MSKFELDQIYTIGYPTRKHLHPDAFKESAALRPVLIATEHADQQHREGRTMKCTRTRWSYPTRWLHATITALLKKVRQEGVVQRPLYSRVFPTNSGGQERHVFLDLLAGQAVRVCRHLPRVRHWSVCVVTHTIPTGQIHPA